MTLKIDVTQDDIAKAITACEGGTWISEGCPVAQALMRMFRGSSIKVAFRTFWVDDVRYEASPEMFHFTKSPTAYWPQLKPGSFDVTQKEEEYASQS